jgi:hypothetical protein
MYDIPVCKQRPIQWIECRHLSKRKVMDKHGRGVGRVMWASRQIDDMESGHRALQAQSSRRVWTGANETSIPCACAHCNYGCGTSADFLRNIKRGATADCAIHAAIGCWNRAFDYDDILAFFLANDALQCRLGSLAIRGHDGFVVFLGESFQDQIFHGWVTCSEHRFSIAGAILKLQPHQDRLLLLTERGCNDLGIADGQCKSRGNRGAELQKSTARYAVTPTQFKNGPVHRTHQLSGARRCE